MRNIFTSLLAISVILSATTSFAKDAPKSKVMFKVTACPLDKKIVEKMILIFTEDAKLTIKTVAGKWLIGEGDPKYSTEVYELDTTKTNTVSVNELTAYDVFTKDDERHPSERPITFVKFKNPKNLDKYDDSKDIINHFLGAGEDFKAEYCK